METTTALVSITVTQRLQVWLTGLPATANKGQTFLLTSEVIDPGTGLLLSWVVLKDGQSYATGSGPTFNFIPNDNGSYSVQLHAINDQMQSSNVLQTTNVLNVAPIASAHWSYNSQRQ